MDNINDAELKKVNHRLDELYGNVEEIRRAILGDEFNTKNGYKQRLEAVENRLTTVEDFISKWRWIIVGCIGFGGYGSLTFTQQLIEIIGTALHKK